jgi:ankyrin repeat protein
LTCSAQFHLSFEISLSQDGSTALHCAARFGQTSVVALLLAEGLHLDPNSEDVRHFCWRAMSIVLTLHIAISFSSSCLLQLMHETALIQAEKADELEVVAMLEANPRVHR